ncbi:MAG: hypothetical protein S4CHLAM81_03520 [Chlamydiales bacterium]|nr:hypothetical protein [Chlamydiales bacterium]MCH9635142.1 hypothetical protein [Chlamydiales bacterium]MCH9703932.1 zinc-ribbon domain-containing protein [Chlamydiota bacterium]
MSIQHTESGCESPSRGLFSLEPLPIGVPVDWAGVSNSEHLTTFVRDALDSGGFSFSEPSAGDSPIPLGGQMWGEVLEQQEITAIRTRALELSVEAEASESNASLKKRARSDSPDPQEAARPRKKKDMRLLKDHLASEEWDEEANGPIGELLCRSSKKVWWICKKDPTHRWEVKIINRCAQTTPSSCPSCRGRKKRYLKDHRVVNEWDLEANGPIPQTLTCGTKKKFQWVCAKDPSHRWMASVLTRCRLNKATGCPHCSGCFRESGTRPAKRYLKDHPVAKEWDLEANGPIPETLTCGTKKKFHWICSVDESHRWRASLYHRCLTTSSATGCPSCAGRSGTSRYVKDHAVAEEWDEERNGTLSDTLKCGSNKKVNWICKEDRTHKWAARINDRTRLSRATGCPTCFLLGSY